MNSDRMKELASAMVFLTAIDCAYDSCQLPKSKPMPGKLIGCHVCGACGVTLYKDGEDRICRKCRKEK